MSRWDFWIDRGGTFTDIVARSPNGVLSTQKLLSENPQHYTDAAIEGIRRILGLGRDEPLPQELIGAIKMGTTVATNALLERTGAPTVLAITKGFADLLRIGTQNRPKIFARNIILPEPLYADVAEINERLNAHGEVLRPLNDDQVRAALEPLARRGFKSIAIVLMHSYRFPAHEQRVAELARALGFTQISISSETSPLMKIVPRGDTTVVDATLAPIVKRYVEGIAAGLGPDAQLSFMQSSGGLIAAEQFRAKDAILSGPAGEIIGMSATARAAGFTKVIGFDMGGTSTDVSHFAGTLERTEETMVAGARVRAPMIEIHTVAAGGGSVCSFDGMRFRVGPESAGAVPGPACYRRGGPLTVTDCNLILGKIIPRHFPSVFGPFGDQPIDVSPAKQLIQGVQDQIERATGERWTHERIADGFIQIAVENMANAIKQVSIARGYDVTQYTLQCFGGAGGQHACLVADALGIGRIMIHPLAGVLSAYGMGLADRRLIEEEAVEAELDAKLLPQLETKFARLTARAHTALAAQGIDVPRIETQRRLRLKYDSTDTALEVAFGDAQTMAKVFEAAYRQRFSFIMPGTSLIVESLVAEAIERNEERFVPEASRDPPQDSVPLAYAQPVLSGERRTVAVFDRARLAPGGQITESAIVIEENATTVIEPGWGARVDRLGNLILERRAQRPQRVAIGTKADPVMLELFNNLFMAIAEQMGVALQNTASSVNIKERLDFSCAVFTADGALIANAPHIPVHLGSMGESVKTILRARANNRDGRGIKPGDVYILNAPYAGGTHLPDITAIMPVFETGASDPLFFTAARGHHADIGGITPGSMPPLSRSILEEGVLFENFLLVDQGGFRESELLDRLTEGKFPARRPAQNIADLRAQVAACARGAHELLKMVGEFGRDVVLAFMSHVQVNAAECVRRVIDGLSDGSMEVRMDNGAIIKVAIRIDRLARRACVDFTGTSPVLPTNFNAPSSIARAAVLYVFRTLVDDAIPMNDGCLEPVDLIIPDHSMLSPGYPAAVVAGNVETSQAVTDALFGALGTMAAAQGTMNNFTFGNDEHQYYETICGGAGAGPDFDGASAVQTHMTNSRLTDPEVIEWRFPVVIEEFAIRRESGGRGLHVGGDGVMRRIKFLKAMTAGILSERRRIAPFGLAGGTPAKPGRNAIEHADGGVEELGATQTVDMGPGDTFVIETPGGGGFGAAKPI